MERKRRRTRWDVHQEEVVPSKKTLPGEWQEVVTGPADEAFAARWVHGDEGPARMALLLLRVKNAADQRVRRQAARWLVLRCGEVYESRAVLRALLELLADTGSEHEARFGLERLLGRVLEVTGASARPLTASVLDSLHGAMNESTAWVVQQLARTVSLPMMLAAVRRDVGAEDHRRRQWAAQVLAVLAATFGVRAVLPFLHAMLQSQVHGCLPRITAALAVQEIAQRAAASAALALSELAPLATTCVRDEQPLVNVAGAAAIARLAPLAIGTGMVPFEAAASSMWAGLQRYHGKMLMALLEAQTALLPRMEPERAAYQARALLPLVMREMRARLPLRVLGRLLAAVALDAELLQTQVLPEWWTAVFEQDGAMERLGKATVRRRVTEVTALLVQQAGAAAMLGEPVLEALQPSRERVVRTAALETVEMILAGGGAATLSEGQLRAVMEAVLVLAQQPPPTPVAALGGVVRAAGRASAPWLVPLANVARNRLHHPSPRGRRQAAQLMQWLAPSLHDADDEAALLQMGAALSEQLGEEFPEVLSAVLDALNAVLRRVRDPDGRAPYAAMLARLVPILRNRDEAVREACAHLVETIARRAAARVPSHEWLRASQEMREMLGSQRRRVRRATVDAFRAIAAAVTRVEDVVRPLLSCLHQSDRQVRVCATVALALAGETCGAKAVVALLLEEYLREADQNVQTGVLKALAFLCEYLGADGYAQWDTELVQALVALLEVALVERHEVVRQMALEVVGHLALALVGLGYEDYVLHLWNLLWPHLVNAAEPGTHLEHAFDRAVQAVAVCVGPARVEGYVLQGLFHPAKAVRVKYWRVARWLRELEEGGVFG
ncbi:hypothetical protein CDCA_CDCA08G2284 [Cyanidium caldarium]|uniref:Phosphatase PP2A regulatory subunit A/Splicing factor 3B subunit 1-like HEAT repeat domain-containing protein n=1 Tax=Cyanidium caldarium TaxID=2771 RepID=A0AAV9IVF8_CYACA|nr:hypothetical protein CDCA_CDCA08G2284 [Cyanidium caldarium]